MEDLQIIDLYWSRDEEAISETSKKYGRMLHSIAMNILSRQEDAEETVSDTYGKAWETMPPQRPKFLSAYLGRIARNLSINLWHKNRAQKRYNGVEVLLSELSQCVPTAQGVETQIENKELAGIISRWLFSLPKGDRVLFMRRYWFGDALQDLAVECGTTSNKLAGRMYRMRESLRKVLEGEGVVL